MLVKEAGDRMAELKRIGNIYGENVGTGHAGNVFDKNGLSPTLISTEGGNKQPMIVDDVETKLECINLYDEQEKETAFQDRVYKTDKISVAITTSFRPSYAVEHKEERFFNQALETLAENDCEPGDTINAYNKTVDKSGVCPTLTTRPEGFKTAILPCVNKYRIRKLTPKECFRLMAVTDEDADKMLSINSNSQCYKQAGNSIVVSVLEALFRNLNIKGVKTWNEVKDNYDFYKKAEVMK